MSNVCRLCLSSDVLFDIFEFDGDISFHMKILSCISIEIYPNDDLPLMICKLCKNEINKFYNFKQQCLRIDSTLRSTYNRFSKTKSNENVTSGVGRNDEGDSLNIQNQTDKSLLRSKFCIEESSWIKSDSYKNKFKIGSNTENKNVCFKKYQCEICGRVFKIKKGLDNHLNTHTGLKQYACNLCPKRFCRAENLTVHKLSHAGIKPYICEVCGKLSSRRQDLIRHMKIHNDNRDYACPKCNRDFKRSSDVSSHMRTHTGMRPYNCKKCAKTYASHSGLRKHKTCCK